MKGQGLPSSPVTRSQRRAEMAEPQTKAVPDKGRGRGRGGRGRGRGETGKGGWKQQTLFDVSQNDPFVGPTANRLKLLAEKRKKAEQEKGEKKKREK